MTTPQPDLAGQRVGPIRCVPDLLRQFGVDPAVVLAECGLAPDALDSAERRISFPTFGALLASAVRATGCEYFGLLVGQHSGLDSLGVVGALARHSPTVGDALRNFAVNHHLNSRASAVFLLEDETHVTLGFTIYDRTTLGVECVHDGVAMILLNAMRELLGAGWRPDEVSLARARPAEVPVYRSAFPGRLVFDAEFTGLRFPARFLAQRPPAADPVAFAMAERQLVATDRRFLVNDLKRVLRIEMIRETTSAERIARLLRVHRRTLNRRLSDVGTTFQAVLDEVRYDSARHLLQLTRMPLSQISASLGYAEASAFTRAFRRWSGTTPARFRSSAPRLQAVEAAPRRGRRPADER